MSSRKLAREQLGRARQVKVNKDNTIIVGGAGSAEDIKARIGQIKSAIETTTSDFDREKLQERLAKLSGGVAVIKVGAATETEMKEKKLRIEDALNATRAAVEEGIVAGGGTAYLNVIDDVARAVLDTVEGDEKTGVRSLYALLRLPFVRSPRTQASKAPSSSTRFARAARSATASTQLQREVRRHDGSRNR